MQNDQDTVEFIVPPARHEGLAPGVFFGKDKNYRLEKFLGEGGMGFVWLATEFEDGVELRKVVCKILPSLVQREKKEMEKVLKTFHLVQPLNHPNICPIYSLRSDPVYGYFFVIGYADGGTLLDWLQDQPDYINGLSLSQVTEILRPIAQALDYAHEMGIMHRDVKPQNILFVTRKGRKVPWLIDFGISAQIHSTTTQTLGDRGTSGTPAYMAPEQCQSRLQDGRTDQYALGVLAYQLLSGHLPFVADNPLALYNQIVYNPVPPLANVSPQTNVALLRAMAKDRKERFDSCEEFVNALEGKTSPVRTLRTAHRPSTQPRKKFQWTLFAGILALVVIGLGIYSISSKRSETVGPTLPVTSNDQPAVPESEESENVLPASTVPESKETENVVSKDVVQKPSVTGSNVPASDEGDFVMSGQSLRKYQGPGNDVVIPSVINGRKVTSIGNSAFRDCKTVTSVVIPEGVTKIGDWSFPGCSALKTVVIPKSVTVIEDGAFGGAVSLMSLELPDGLKKIGDQAFLNCSSLPSVVIPDSVQEIGGGAFSQCTALKEWTLSPNHPYFKTDGSGLLTKDGKKLVACLPSAKEYRIPDGVTEIGTEAFSYSSISSVVIPKSVTEIGERAFELSHSLTSIVLPEGLKEIGNGAFACCSSLTSAVIPDSMQEIGGGAFRGCPLEKWSISSNHPYFKTDGNVLLTKDGKKLVACLTSAEEYKIPNGVTKIGSLAFADCKFLFSIEIPESVTKIGDHGFMRCTSLTSIEIPGSVTEIEDSAFWGCPNLTIRAPKGSKAEEYAKENGIPFEAK